MSVYDEIGGADAVKVAVAVFYNRVTVDELLTPWFAGIDLERLKAHQRAFLTAALGGPDVFLGRTMEAAHQPLAITDEAFDRIAEHLAASLLDVGVDPVHVRTVIDRIEPMREQVVANRAGATTSR